jgi:hypothetical protein
MRISLALFGLAVALEIVLLARGPEPIPRGASVLVPAGGDLQAALNSAKPGDVITLEPGATYVGNFKLPATSGSEFITIRSGADPSQFPVDGRVGPEHERWMPVLRSPNTTAALATTAGAHHWKLQWLAFHANAGGFGDIITLGDGGPDQHDLERVPHDFILDGLIIRGDPVRGQKRAIALNSAATVIRNSDIRDIKAVGQDSQAICGWNGPGPFVIENNYLEAAGENIMFGGADPRIPDLVPTDITVADNYITKPLEWREKGSRWSVKNLFELKSARRVLVERNVFEHNWVASQPGYAILFSPTNQGGRAPWTVVSDITFRYNIVRHVSSAFNISGFGWQQPTQQTRGIEIRHNLLYDVDSSRWAGVGRFMMIGPEPADIVVDHNTVVHSGSIVHFHGKKDGRPRPIRNFQFTNNLVLHNAYGIMGDDAGPGKLTISNYLVREDIRRNVFAGAQPSRYPPDNFFPTVEEFFRQFVAPAQEDYRLLPTSPYVNAATDGSRLGADVDTILRDAPTREPRDRKSHRRTPPDIR